MADLGSFGEMTVPPLSIAGLVFSPTEFGWTTVLAPEFPTFFGHSLSITVGTSTLSCALKDLPRPSATQIALVEFLMPRLSEAMLSCTVAFKRECDDLDILSDLTRPDVWIPSDGETDGDSCWSLVVERASDLEDGYHIECDGVTVVNLFACGDLR